MKRIKLTNLFVMLLGLGIIMCLPTLLHFLNSVKLFETSKPRPGNIEILRPLLRTREKAWIEILKYSEEHEKEREKRLPRFIGIGVKKCGTNGIISFLGHHPLVEIPRRSEAYFFNNKKNLKCGMDCYIRFFPPINDKEVTGEKTPSYFDMPPHDLPESIKSNLPNVKLLLIVCDPVKRVFSDYVHERARFKLFNDPLVAKYPTFESYLNVYLPKMQKIMETLHEAGKDDDAIGQKLTELFHEDERLTLIAGSLYAYHIQRWNRVFNNTNLMIINGDDFLNSPGPIVEKMQDFIGVPKLLMKEDFVKHPKTGFFCFSKFTENHLKESLVVGYENLNRTLKCLVDTKGRTRNGAKKLLESSAVKLSKFFKPYNNKFFSKLGQSFEWNSSDST